LRAIEHFIIILDIKGNITWMDRNSKNLIPDGIQGSLSIFDIFQEQDHSTIEMALAAAMDSGREERTSARLLKTSSGQIDVTLWIDPLEGNDNLCTVVISRPTSESDVEFMDLHSFVLTVDEAMDKVQSPVISADQHARVLMLNLAAEELSGFTTREVFGKNINTLFALEEGSSDDFKKALKAVMKGDVRNINAPLQTKAGKIIDQSWRITYAVIGEEGEGILMAFGYDPQKVPKSVDSVAEFEDNLSLLVSRSADLAGALDPSGKVDEDLMRLVEAQSLHFGIMYVEGSDNGTMIFHAGVDRARAEGILDSPLLVLKELSRVENPVVVELDPWAHRGKMPQAVNSILYIPIGSGTSSRGFAIFGTEGSLRRWASRTPILQIFCNQILASLRHSGLIKMLASRTMELQSLYEVSHVLTSTLDIETLLQEVVEKGCSLANANRCDVYRTDERTDLPVLLKSHVLNEGPSGSELGDLAILEVTKTGKSIIYNEAAEENNPFSIKSSMIGVPLIVAGEVAGAMALYRCASQFTERDLKVMELYATTTALALRNASLYEKLNGTALELQAYNDLLAHDVANYNVPIHGYLEILISNPCLDEKQKGYVWKALKQSDNITSLVSNVRRLAEIRLREGSKEMKPVDIVPILSQIIADHSNTICDGTVIRFEPSIESAMVNGDEEVRDIFMNLLKNACQYGGGSIVEISVSRHLEDGGTYWKVDFSDQGKGVPNEWKERIFQRFWETDSDRRAETKGLGLCVVQALCQHYGGMVWVSDRVDGKPSSGSVFSVILPIAMNPN
jgi:PAS domain S-box-containing protein